jgi:capsid protein
MRREWFFDGFEHVDPLREASAQALRLENFSTTYADEYARQGKDWQQQLEQVARERELMESLGITAQEVQATFVPQLIENEGA